MKAPRQFRTASLLAAILAVPTLRVEAQEREQRTGYWASIAIGQSAASQGIGEWTLVRRSRDNNLVALSFASARLAPYETSGDTSVATRLDVTSVALGRWWPRDGYAIRALGGLGFATKVRSTIVRENSSCGEFTNVSCSYENLARGPAATGSLGVDWMGTRAIWFGVELNGAVASGGGWLGLAATISFGRRD